MGGEMLLDFRLHLLGEVGAPIEHGHDDAFDDELGGGPGVVELLDKVQDDGDALQREILALQGDEEAVGGAERVHGEDAQGGRAVDENEVVGVLRGDGGEDTAEAVEVVGGLGDIDFRAGEVKFGGDDVEAEELRFEDLGVQGGLLGEEGVVDGGPGRLGKAEAAGGVGLGVEVDEQDGLAAFGERRGQVDGGGGLADAALLVGDGNDGGGHGKGFSARPAWTRGGENTLAGERVQQKEKGVARMLRPRGGRSRRARDGEGRPD